ncbi:hypothetical protein P7K49_004621 [Saguinus oedipus]|uniref:Uncharacterized protein n=1 Tax=Saguinus oedipus TaxID=9490 RepID=A0ABQ9W7Y3_SAGOE|nr:hypothetical protein P7K49_004621 [Saguinus oedipus]
MNNRHSANPRGRWQGKEITWSEDCAVAVIEQLSSHNQASLLHIMKKCPKSFAKAFSSGYLIGEVLHKFELQDDFSEFLESS